MRKRIRHILTAVFLLVLLTGVFCVGANAFNYEGSVQDVNVNTYSITIGGTKLPLRKYPIGSHSPYSGIYTSYMTVSEAKEYGITLSKDLWLRSAECMAFARYVYAALYYKYPATSTMDNYIASTINSYGSYAYVDMISSEWIGGSYSAADFEQLVKSCYPGSFIRQGGHSMVIMSIFDDGLVVYDANYSYSDYNVVDVRKYTWEGYINKFGGQTIYALQTPSYYPGYYDSLGRSGGDGSDYDLDTSVAGLYEVVVGSTLNVRSGPSVYSSIVGRLSNGDEITVHGSYNNWAAIDYNGAFCWISMDYLRVIELSPIVDGYHIDISKEGEYEVCNTNKVNVRALPTVNSQDVGDLYRGEVVDVRGTYNGWAAIKYGGDDCWVSLDYLTPKLPKVTVKFDASGGTTSLSSGEYTIGNAFGELPTASKSHRVFLGWYSGGVKYTSATIVPAAGITLTAKWGIEVFIDVAESDWFAPAVEYVYNEGVMNGAGMDIFCPQNMLTRSSAAQILYNLAGRPGITAFRSTFSDVSTDAWYFNAVEWCAANGLISGNGEGGFMPDNNISRQDFVLILMRYASNYLGEDVSVRADISHFADASSVSGYAYEAMQWAVGSGLINGTGEGLLVPQGQASRSVIAQIMMSFLK